MNPLGDYGREAPALDGSPLRLARLSGLLYLVIIVCGVGGEPVLRSPLLAAAAPYQTAVNLRVTALAFRLSILCDVAMALSDVALAVLLYALFRPLGETLARMAMAFRLVQAAILGLNLLNLHQAVTLAAGGATDALPLMFLEAHAAGYDIGLLFFGVNCLLMGLLTLRATFLAPFFGWMLVAAGLVYLIGGVLHIVSPDAISAFAPAYAIPLIAELAFCLWLLIKGVDATRWQELVLLRTVQSQHFPPRS